MQAFWLPTVTVKQVILVYKMHGTTLIVDAYQDGKLGHPMAL